MKQKRIKAYECYRHWFVSFFGVSPECCTKLPKSNIVKIKFEQGWELDILQKAFIHGFCLGVKKSEKENRLNKKEAEDG